MTSTSVTAPTGTPTGGGGPTRRIYYGWWIVAALAITQTVGYGVLYYAFTVLLMPTADALGVSTTSVTGTYTASVLAGTILAVPVGRFLDRHGGRLLMTIGSTAGTLLVIAWANVHTIGQLYAVQIGIGLAGAMALYEPAFAVVVRWFDPGRRANALLAVTVVAGFASSIFLPLTGYLVDQHGWRSTLLILAAIHGVTTIPLHALVLRQPRLAAATDSPTRQSRLKLRAVLRERGFWLLATAFTAHAAAIATFTIYLVVALTSWGHSVTLAATIAGLLGVLSVTGRLVTTALQRRGSVTTIAAAVFLLQALAALVLPWVGQHTVGAIVAVTGFGLGFGVATIARPAIIANRYPTSHYATISGLITVPVTIAKALAPVAAGLAHQVIAGYTLVFVATAASCMVGAVALGFVGAARNHLQFTNYR